MEDIGIAHVTQGVLEKSKHWHNQCGHINPSSLKLMAHQSLIEGLPNITHVDKYEPCALGKHHRLAYPKHEAKRAQAPLELVHGNLAGPMQTPTLGGNVYFSS